MFVCHDLTYLSFSLLSSNSRGTGGSFFKAKDNNYYYKLSYASGYNIIGFESIYEAIANELLQQLNLPYAEGELIYGKVILSENIKPIETYIWKTKDYNPDKLPVSTLETQMQISGVDTDNPYNVLVALDKYSPQVKNQIDEMVLFDYLSRNIDRHGANIEVLFKENDEMICTPIYDNGCSLFTSCHNDIDAIKKLDYIKNSPANNFIGSHYLEDAAIEVSKIYKRDPYNVDLSFIDKYMNCFGNLSSLLSDKITDLINQREARLNEILKEQDKII